MSFIAFLALGDGSSFRLVSGQRFPALLNQKRHDRRPWLDTRWPVCRLRRDVVEPRRLLDVIFFLIVYTEHQLYLTVEDGREKEKRRRKGR